MSCAILKTKPMPKSMLYSGTVSQTSVFKQDLRHLKTFYNVSYTDYCGMSFKNRVKADSSSNKSSFNSQKRGSQFWRYHRRPEITFQRGDSLRVQSLKVSDSARLKPERVKTEYSTSKIFRHSKNKSNIEFFKVYQLQFLEKKVMPFEAEGHKLKISKITNNKQKQMKALYRPNTAYLKRANPVHNNDARKMKTVGLKDAHQKDENFYAINGWQNDVNEYQF